MIRTLVCSCCHSQTRGRQFFNQDKGIGICERCVKDEKADQAKYPGLGSDYVSSTYGKEGYHFNIQED